MCVPTASVAEMLAPVPRLPEMLELQWIWLEIAPSKSSMAVPLRVTGLPAIDEPPSAGAVIATEGATLGLRTRTVICPCPAIPELSVTAAVIVCVPTRRGTLDYDAPLPRAPSRLDVQVS